MSRSFKSGSILNEQQHKDIYNYLENDHKTISELADKFNVSKSTIKRARKRYQEYLNSLNGDVESHVTEPEVIEQEEQETDDNVTYYWVVTKSSIVVTCIDEKNDLTQVVIESDDPDFKELCDLIENGHEEGAKTLLKRRSVKHALREFYFGDNNSISVDVDRNEVSCNYNGANYVLSPNLETRIISAVRYDNPEELVGLLKFTDRLLQNPSDKVVNELYEFIAAKNIKINKDGMVICYKRVTADFKDCFTETFDNSIGSTPSVPRNTVESDSNQLCASGLHVCSASYLSHYKGDVVIEVMVDPIDFISIPSVYYMCDDEGIQHRAKARVCKYHVLHQVEGLV